MKIELQSLSSEIPAHKKMNSAKSYDQKICFGVYSEMGAQEKNGKTNSLRNLHFQAKASFF